MSHLVFALPGNEILASRLAALSGGELGHLESRHFPDGETYLRFAENLEGRSIVLACSLDRPDAKIPALIFAADAARELGARRVGLAAPYLCYMRQDRRFQPGEAVTSRSFAGLVSRHFDWLVTVDPHLHRLHRLEDIYTIPAMALHAAPVIADWIKQNVAEPYLIGPDEESRQWIETVARGCGAPWTVLSKIRAGDRQVSESAISGNLAGRTPVLLDDIISSGATLAEAVRHLPQAAHPPVIVAIHAVCDEGVSQSFSRMGARLVTSNSVPSPTATIDIVPLLAGGVRALI